MQVTLGKRVDGQCVCGDDSAGSSGSSGSAAAGDSGQTLELVEVATRAQSVCASRSSVAARQITGALSNLMEILAQHRANSAACDRHKQSTEALHLDMPLPVNEAESSVVLSVMDSKSLCVVSRAL